MRPLTQQEKELYSGSVLTPEQEEFCAAFGIPSSPMRHVHISEEGVHILEDIPGILYAPRPQPIYREGGTREDLPPIEIVTFNPQDIYFRGIAEVVLDLVSENIGTTQGTDHPISKPLDIALPLLMRRYRAYQSVGGNPALINFNMIKEIALSMIDNKQYSKYVKWGDWEKRLAIMIEFLQDLFERNSVSGLTGDIIQKAITRDNVKYLVEKCFT